MTRSFAAFEVLGVAVDTIQTAENGGAWGKELFEGLSGIGGGWVCGVAAMLFFADPLGWLVVIPAAGLSLAGEVLSKWIAEQIDGR